MDKIIFSERLAAKRKEIGFETQIGFAAEYDRRFPPKRRDESGGVAGKYSGIFGTLKKYENPNNPIKPSLEIVANMCKILGCDVDYLLGNIEEKSHDIQFIHDQTGLSEAAITALRYANSSSKKRDLITLQNKRIINLINLALEKDGKIIEKINDGEKYVLNDLFTLLYDYAFADRKGAVVSPASVSFSYDLSLDKVEYDTLPLFREATITAIRQELDSFSETK